MHQARYHISHKPPHKAWLVSERSSISMMLHLNPFLSGLHGQNKGHLEKIWSYISCYSITVLVCTMSDISIHSTCCVHKPKFLMPGHSLLMLCVILFVHVCSGNVGRNSSQQHGKLFFSAKQWWRRYPEQSKHGQSIKYLLHLFTLLRNYSECSILF